MTHLSFFAESKSKRVPLKKKYKIIRKVKEHKKKKAKEAKKLHLSGKKKVEKDPGIPNDWPFKEQELKALEARRERVIQELEQKKAERKERVFDLIFFFQRKTHTYMVDCNLLGFVNDLKSYYNSYILVIWQLCWWCIYLFNSLEL